MATYIEDHSAAFREMGDPSDMPNKRRSESRLKNIFSATDARAWSTSDEENRQYILDLIRADVPRQIVGKYVPIEVLIDTLLANRNADIDSLRQRIRELEDVIDYYESLDLSPQQRQKVAQYKAQITKSSNRLDSMGRPGFRGSEQVIATQDLEKGDADKIPSAMRADESRPKADIAEVSSKAKAEEDMSVVGAGPAPIEDIQAKDAKGLKEPQALDTDEPKLIKGGAEPEALEKDDEKSMKEVASVKDAAAAKPLTAGSEDEGKGKEDDQVTKLDAMSVKDIDAKDDTVSQKSGVGKTARIAEPEDTTSSRIRDTDGGKDAKSITSEVSRQPTTLVGEEGEISPEQLEGGEEMEGVAADDQRSVAGTISRGRPGEAEEEEGPPTIEGLQKKLADKDRELEKQRNLAKEAIEKLERLKAIMERENENLKKKLRDSEQELLKLRGRLPRKESCLADLSAKEAELEQLKESGQTSEIEAIQKEVQLLKKYCAKLNKIKDENKKLKAENESMKSKGSGTKLDSVHSEIVSIHSKPGKDDEHYKEQMELLNKKINHLKEITLERDKLQASVTRLEKQLEDYGDLSSEIQSFKEKSQMMEGVMAENQDLAARLERMRGLEEELEALKRKADRADELEKMLAGRGSQSRSCGSDEEMDKHRAQEVEVLKIERDRLKVRLDELEDMEREYEEMKEKLAALEAIEAERDDLKQKYEELLQEMQCLRQQADRAKALEIERDTLLRRVRDLECVIADQEGEIANLVTHVERLSRGQERQQDRMKRQVCQLREELEKKCDIITDSEEQLAGLQDQLRTTISAVSSQQENNKCKIEELNCAIYELSSEKGCLQKQITCLEDDRKDILKETDELRQSASALKYEITKYKEKQRKSEEMKKAMENMKSELDSYKCRESESEDLRKANARMTKEIQKLKVAQKESESAKKCNDQLNKTVAKYKKKLSESENVIATLKQKSAVIQGENDKLQEIALRMKDMTDNDKIAAMSTKSKQIDTPVVATKQNECGCPDISTRARETVTDVVPTKRAASRETATEVASTKPFAGQYEKTETVSKEAVTESPQRKAVDVQSPKMDTISKEAVTESPQRKSIDAQSPKIDTRSGQALTDTPGKQEVDVQSSRIPAKAMDTITDTPPTKTFETQHDEQKPTGTKQAATDQIKTKPADVQCEDDTCGKIRKLETKLEEMKGAQDSKEAENQALRKHSSEMQEIAKKEIKSLEDELRKSKEEIAALRTGISDDEKKEIELKKKAGEEGPDAGKDVGSVKSGEATKLKSASEELKKKLEDEKDGKIAELEETQRRLSQQSEADKGEIGRLSKELEQAKEKLKAPSDEVERLKKELQERSEAGLSEEEKKRAAKEGKTPSEIEAARRESEQREAEKRKSELEGKDMEEGKTDKTKEAEADKAKEAAAEKGKEADADKAKEAEADKAKQTAAERAKEAEAEKAKEAEAKGKETDADKEKKTAADKAKEEEAEKAKEAEGGKAKGADEEKAKAAEMEKAKKAAAEEKRLSEAGKGGDSDELERLRKKLKECEDNQESLKKELEEAKTAGDPKALADLRKELEEAKEKLTKGGEGGIAGPDGVRGGQKGAGGPTAGGPTAGGPTAGGPTAGGPTAGGPTAGGPTAGATTGRTSAQDGKGGRVSDAGGMGGPGTETGADDKFGKNVHLADGTKTADGKGPLTKGGKGGPAGGGPTAADGQRADGQKADGQRADGQRVDGQKAGSVSGPGDAKGRVPGDKGRDAEKDKREKAGLQQAIDKLDGQLDGMGGGTGGGVGGKVGGGVGGAKGKAQDENAPQEYERRISDLENKLQKQKDASRSSMRSLKNQYDRDVKNLQNKYRDGVDKLQASHEEIIAATNREMEREVDDLRRKSQMSDQKIKSLEDELKKKTSQKMEMGDVKDDECECDCFRRLLRKILREGLESLNFNELQFIHSRIADATSKLMDCSGQPDQVRQMRDCFDSPSDGELRRRQKAAQGQVAKLQLEVAMERQRLEDLKRCLDKERKTNSDLTNRIMAQRDALEFEQCRCKELEADLTRERRSNQRF